MSKPNYLRKADTPNSIVVKVEGLVTHLYKITNNEKQFPKAFRYTLVNDIRNTCLSMHKNVSKAIAIHPRFRKEYKRRKKYQNKAYMDLIDLKSLLIIALDVASMSNPEFVATQMEIVVDAYTKWIKNDKRNFSKLPSKKEYFEQRRLIREHRRMLRAESTY